MNPALFLDTEKRLAGWVVEAVMKVADKHKNELLAGATLVSVVEQVMVAQARSARAALKNHAAETLVNQLRVRQAMLLTVNGQYNLAEQRWKDVDGSALTKAWDKSLYDNSETIVWWYRRAKIQEPLDLDIARGHKQRLDPGLKGLQDPSIRIYLATIQAQIALKTANDADVSDPQKQSEVANTMVRGLERYVQYFSSDDQQWVIDNPNSNVKKVRS